MENQSISKSELSTPLHFVIQKDSGLKFIFFAFLFCGYLNAVLRLEPDSGITLFRILLPPAALLCFLVFRSMAIKFCLAAVVFLAYSSLITSLFSRFPTINWVYYFHYVTLIFIGLLTLSLQQKYGSEALVSHLRSVYIFMILLAVLQLIIGYELPNTTYRGTLNIYYWVENDFSTALAAFIPFLLVIRKNRITNLILAVAGISIILFNESRIALLSMVFFIAFKMLNRFGRVGYITAAFLLICLLVIFQDLQLGGNTLSQLLIEPFTRIFTLTTYERHGSIFDRTNALIFGIRELKSSLGFGIGPGNATAMLALPEYYLPTAQSMHNFVAHIIVEFGWLMLAMFIYVSFYAYNFRRRIGIPAKNDRIFFIYLIAAGLASLSQSEGLFSNYYFFVCVFTSIGFFGSTQQRNGDPFPGKSQNQE